MDGSSKNWPPEKLWKKLCHDCASIVEISHFGHFPQPIHSRSTAQPGKASGKIADFRPTQFLSGISSQASTAYPQLNSDFSTASCTIHRTVYYCIPV